MAEVIKGKVKMKKRMRDGCVVITNSGRRLGMIGHIPEEGGLRLFFEYDRFKSYKEIKDTLLAVAKAIPDKPKTAL